MPRRNFRILNNAEQIVTATDKVFAGSIPEIYDRFLVPLIFEPYANDLAKLAARAQPRDLWKRQQEPACSPEH